jgi:hypothetical protein
VKARAWLANVMAPDLVAALGIGRGLPISAMKAAEQLRNQKDPAGGSRMAYLERIAQQESDRRAATMKAARERKAKRAVQLEAIGAIKREVLGIQLEDEVAP